jgi:hypothetical protein
MLNLLGVIIAATIFTVALTPVVAFVILRRFQRVVRRSMLAASSAPRPSASEVCTAPGSGAPRARTIAVLEGPQVASGRPGELTMRATGQMRRAVGWYVIAGLAYAATQTTVFFLLEGHEFLIPRAVVVGFLFAWPIVPTLMVVMAPRRRVVVFAVSAYALVAGILGLFAGQRVSLMLTLWTVQEGPPTLALLAVAGRRHRAVGPFLAPAVFVLGTSPLIAWWAGTLAISAGVPPPIDWVLALAAIAVAVLAALLVVPVAASRYRRKAASDLSVLVDQWWLIFAFYHCLLVAGSAGWSSLTMLLPYAAYRLVTRFGRWRLYRSATEHVPVRLLLLRVFGSRSRSERLLRDVGAYWRYLGSVQLIAGTDLAAEALEPHEFLDFAIGKLSRHFVQDDDDIGERIAKLDLLPDADGRFRVNEFFCHDDAWRPAVRAGPRRCRVMSYF